MPRRKLKSFEDFNRALKNKYGVGEGKAYKPWLRVQYVKSNGVRSQIIGLKTGRVHHTLSSIGDLESEIYCATTIQNGSAILASLENKP